jgi:hypothetical protein
MAKRNDTTALLGAAALGFLLGAIVSSGSEGATERRAKFLTRMRERLAQVAIDLVNAEIASGANGAREWQVTLTLPSQFVTTLRAPLERGQDSLSDATCDEVTYRILTYLRGQGQV